MKIKIEKLIGSTEALKNLFTAPVPVSVAFLLSKIIKEFEENLKFFDDARNAAIQKYGKEQKDGTFKVGEKEGVILNKEVQDLLNTEIEFHADPINIDKLNDITLSASDMYSLDWLLTE